MNSSNSKPQFHSLNWFYVLIRSLLWIIGKIYFRVTKKGNENIPKTGPVIIACSHQSFLDPPLVAITNRRAMHFMARHDLFDIPVLGRAIRKLNAFPIHRGGADRKALKRTFDILEAGEMILIFPEGTRSQDSHLQPGEPGVGMIIYKAKVPVVPCYIEGAYNAFSRHMKFPHPKKITLHYTSPPDLSKFYNMPPEKETYQKIVNVIMSSISKLIPQSKI